jgi:translocation and assembly module TamB
VYDPGKHGVEQSPLPSCQMAGRKHQSRRKRRWDVGRLVARLLCAGFALVGVLPLVAGLLISSEPVLSWAAVQTARILHSELGLRATYRVEVTLWPLHVSMHDVLVPASDGGPPALRARRVAVRPRIFSLLAGRLDAGDIEIDELRGRLVIRDGKLRNLDYRLPERGGDAAEMTRPPFSSLTVTDAVVELDVQGLRVRAGPFDLDVFAGWGPSFELALRVAAATLDGARSPAKPEADNQPTVGDRNDAVSPAGPAAVDEDVVCALDLRARYEPKTLLLRRLSLLGAADLDPRRGTRPVCQQLESRPGELENEVALRVSQLRIEQREGHPPLASGHVVARAPVALSSRLGSIEGWQGWVGLVADVRYDGRTRLPQVYGKLRGANLRLLDYRLGEKLQTEFEVVDDRLRLPQLQVKVADGTVVATNLTLDPFARGAALDVERVQCNDVEFPGLMRDIDVTDHTVVAWDIRSATVTKFAGTLHPLRLDGDLRAETHDFEVFDRSVHDPARRHVIGVNAALVHSRIGVTPDAFEFYDANVRFGHTALFAPLVSIGFANDIRVEVDKSQLDLSDVSPLVDIPWDGQSELKVTMAGQTGDPLLTAELAIRDFVFAGFPVGDIHTKNAQFRPLKLDLVDVQGRKGRTAFAVPTARLDFDTAASVLVEAELSSETLDVRDFFSVFHFDEDPRFEQITGSTAVQAHVRYALGGPQDRCTGGYVQVQGDLSVHSVELFEERFDGGHARFDFRWFDRDASYLGIALDVPSITLKKGTGTVLGSLSMRQGAALSGHFVATGVPVAEIQSLGTLGQLLDARAGAVAEVSGSVDELRVDAHVNVSPTRIGGMTLGSSELAVTLKPTPGRLRVAGTTRCGQPVPAPFDRAEYDRDEALGNFHVKGSLFGNQLQLGGVQITRQRAKHVSGEIRLVQFDLGAVGELLPEALLPSGHPDGRLTAQLLVEDLALQDPYATRASVSVSELELRHAGLRIELLPGARTVTLRDGRLDVPGLAVAVATPGGAQGVFDAQAAVERLGAGAEVDAALRLRPVQLASLAQLLPRVERASGQMYGELRVTGPIRTPSYSGGFRVEQAELAVQGLSAPITNLELELGIDDSELRIRRGSARVGGGTVQVSGSAPLRGFELGEARGVVSARSLAFAPAEHVRVTLDADLIASYSLASAKADGDRPLPRLTGDVTVQSFEYARPITLSADINSLAQRGRRTQFESYDPADDTVELDITLHAGSPLRIDNNLVAAQLEVPREGLKLAGTNQRFGLRGAVRVRPGGRLRLRRNEFEIQHGTVRFDDLTRVAPQVDVTAVTEYRRYSESLGEQNPSQASATSASSTTAAGGQWRIVLHAYGDADKLRVDLTSQPALPQDDIFLLLTVGLTRAELDQARSASVGESVALEALGTFSGADQAVSEALPVIDDFRFGSAYSSRTGRTEPTVTVGKRLAERIRANVTSGLTDSREVRSNVQWRLSRRVSVEGSYDNVNDISSSALGNLGADIRWRLEFE